MKKIVIEVESCRRIGYDDFWWMMYIRFVLSMGAQQLLEEIIQPIRYDRYKQKGKSYE